MRARWVDAITALGPLVVIALGAHDAFALAERYRTERAAFARAALPSHARTPERRVSLVRAALETTFARAGGTLSAGLALASLAALLVAEVPLTPGGAPGDHAPLRGIVASAAAGLVLQLALMRWALPALLYLAARTDDRRLRALRRWRRWRLARDRRWLALRGRVRDAWRTAWERRAFSAVVLAAMRRRFLLVPLALALGLGAVAVLLGATPSQATDLAPRRSRALALDDQVRALASADVATAFASRAAAATLGPDAARALAERLGGLAPTPPPDRLVWSEGERAALVHALGASRRALLALPAEGDARVALTSFGAELARLAAALGASEPLLPEQEWTRLLVPVDAGRLVAIGASLDAIAGEPFILGGAPPTATTELKRLARALAPMVELGQGFVLRRDAAALALALDELGGETGACVASPADPCRIGEVRALAAELSALSRAPAVASDRALVTTPAEAARAPTLALQRLVADSAIDELALRGTSFATERDRLERLLALVTLRARPERRVASGRRALLIALERARPELAPDEAHAASAVTATLARLGDRADGLVRGLDALTQRALFDRLASLRAALAPMSQAPLPSLLSPPSPPLASPSPPLAPPSSLRALLALADPGALALVAVGLVAVAFVLLRFRSVVATALIGGHVALAVFVASALAEMLGVPGGPSATLALALAVVLASTLTVHVFAGYWDGLADKAPRRIEAAFSRVARPVLAATAIAVVPASALGSADLAGAAAASSLFALTLATCFALSFTLLPACVSIVHDFIVPAAQHAHCLWPEGVGTRLVGAALGRWFERVPYGDPGMALEHEEDIVTITIRRPPLNLLDARLASKGCQYTRSSTADPDVRGIIVRSGLPRVLHVVGADGSVMLDAHGKPLRVAPADAAAFALPPGHRFAGPVRPLGAGADLQLIATDLLNAFFVLKSAAEFAEMMWYAPKPIIYVVEGDAVAGWFEIAMHANCFLVTRHARVGAPEVRSGLTLPFGSHALTYRAGTPVAQHLMATGDFVSGEEAVRLGIADGLVPDGVDPLEYAKSLIRTPGFIDGIRQTAMLRQYGPPMKQLIYKSVRNYINLLRKPETQQRMRRFAKTSEEA